MSRLLAGLVTAGFLLIGLFIIFGSVGAAENDLAIVDDTVENESIVQDVGNWTPVDAQENGTALSFNDTVTVRNQNGDVLTEGQDYEWAPGNGSVFWNSTPDTSDGADATVTYTYQRHPEEAIAVHGILIPVMSPLWVFAYVAIFIFTLGLFVWVVIQIGESTGTALGGGR